MQKKARRCQNESNNARRRAKENHTHAGMKENLVSPICST